MTTPDESAKDEAAGPETAPGKYEKLADEAVQKGRELLETDTGRKVAEVAETGFAKAEELMGKAMSSDAGKQVADAAKQAQDTGKQILSTELGKNIAIGAGAGAVAGLVLPFFGTVVGAVIGGGLGYLRTITKGR
ncbi:hypothetical protein [Sandarakinorhabdus sp.]|uniref:hypothetical protein n=1 Tax=Sandarakinorhabdus sp. TaxID=1916663 RepID=UPI00286D9557|nr:hypothetical protein [Sandarakinorhabdus sp.]